MLSSSRKQLGRLELLAEIQLGGSSQFFHARDTRNGREVGVLVLPLTHGTPVNFEARHHDAAKLKHPNILGIRGLRTKADISYLVTERVDGESLAMILKHGPLAIPEAVDFADQIVQALEVAHSAKVVHGDLSPAHILVDDAGDIKVLGFSLIPLGPFGEGECPNEYVSPEAIRGQELDARSDIFSFGSTLYEMLAGYAPFRRRSADETGHAILGELAEPLPDKVPGDLAALVGRCLRKNPAERFQTAGELKSALRNLLVQSLADPVADLSPGERRLHGWSHVARAQWELGKTSISDTKVRLTQLPQRWTALGLATLALLMAGDLFVRVRSGRTMAVPTFQRLTFRQGPILRARFADHGRSVAYTARFEGAPQTSYLLAATGAVRELNLPPNSSVLAVSSKGDLAVRMTDGSLARLPATGGSLVNEARTVLDADFSPAGDSLALARLDSARNYLLEYPLGHALVQSQQPIDLVRVSPQGDRVAFSKVEGVRRRLWIVNRAGETRMLADLGSGDANRSLSWSSDGKEIWFGAAPPSERGLIQAVTVDGKRRVVSWIPEGQVDDTGPNGDGLIEMFRSWSGTRVRGISADHDTDLSWFGDTISLSLSTDGKRVFSTEHGAGKEGPAVYVRGRSGPPVRLCEGSLVAVSPDAKWVSVYRPLPRPRYFLVPTNGGKEKPVEIAALDGQTAAVVGWLADGSYIVWGREPQTNRQHFVWNPLTGKFRPVSPDGSSLGLASDDGRRLLATGPNGAYYVFPVDRGEPTLARGLSPTDQILRWSTDDAAIFIGTVSENRRMFSIFKLDLNTGVRTLWRNVEPDIQADNMVPASITPDGSVYAYLYFRAQSELFLAHGLR